MSGGHEDLPRRRPSHGTVIAYVALFVALGGTAWSAATIGSKDIKRNAVKSKQIASESVRGQELRDDAVDSAKVEDGTLTGDDVNGGTLQNVDAATLGGKPPAGFVSGQWYFRSSAIAEGTLLANGRYQQSVSCDPGDLAISGGPDRVSAPSLLVSSVGASTGWFVVIDKMGGNDTFAATVICSDQTP